MEARLMYLLDTNVVSQRKAKRPEVHALRFLEELPKEQAFLSVITLMEIRAGIEKLEDGTNQRDLLEDWLVHYLPKEFAGRVLPITSAIADAAGRMLMAERKAKRTPDLADVLIASTATVHGMTVATLNRKHFEPLGVPLAKL